MPAPAVYVLAVVSTVAAGVAFYQFVYEPHIHPKVTAWAHNIRARQQARRRQQANAIPVNAQNSPSLPNSKIENDDKQSYELEQLVSNQVLAWRGEVSRSQNSTIRQRKVPTARPALGGAMDESIETVPFEPMTPTHIITDSSDLSTPTSTVSSRLTSPSIRASVLHGSPEPSTARPVTVSSPARSPFDLPPPSSGMESSHSSLPTQSFGSPSLVPSLSLSHPVDLDQEHDIELLSAPSSRPDSPFSSFSHTTSISEYFSYAGSTNGREASSFSPRGDDVMSVQSESSMSLTSVSDLDPSSPRSSISDFSVVSAAGQS